MHHQTTEIVLIYDDTDKFTAFDCDNMNYLHFDLTIYTNQLFINATAVHHYYNCQIGRDFYCGRVF